jgi:hypothetical protein
MGDFLDFFLLGATANLLLTSILSLLLLGSGLLGRGLLGGGILGRGLLGSLGLLDGTSVDGLSRVDGHTLDQTLLLELTDGATSQRTVNLKSVRHNGRSDELVGGDLLEESVVGLLVKDNLVGKLVLDVSLGPLLLLLLTTTSGGSLGLGGGGLSLILTGLLGGLCILTNIIFVSTQYQTLIQ